MIQDFSSTDFATRILTIETLDDGRVICRCLFAHHLRYVATVDFVMHPDEIRWVRGPQ